MSPLEILEQLLSETVQVHPHVWVEEKDRCEPVFTLKTKDPAQLKRVLVRAHRELEAARMRGEVRS